MRSAAKDKRRERPAAMITFRSPSAHVSYWRKSGNICPKKRQSFWSQESRGDQPVSGTGNCYLINNVTAKPKRTVPKSVFWHHSAIVARLKEKANSRTTY